MPVTIRNAEPSDYDRISPLVDDWWGGRQLRPLLPRLFFKHFRETSFVAEDDGQLIGFLNGFLSQTHPGEAYIHFVGVHPDRRGTGLATDLYERFFGVARAYGRKLVRCVTSPVNEGSVAFHRALGFDVERGDEYMLLTRRI
jgi:ribosomal protein S18 acetylase RimI-like enzyme